jgi:hypothetical protein
MNRPRLIRGLRIAVSAVCGILCLLLIVLWVRTYRNPERLSLGRVLTLSMKGHVLFYELPDDSIPWQLVDPYSNAAAKTLLATPTAFSPVPVGPYVTASYWFLVFVTGATAIFLGCWPPYRFSLRTLLIAMTLIAVVLGLVMWNLR